MYLLRLVITPAASPLHVSVLRQSVRRSGRTRKEFRDGRWGWSRQWKQREAGERTALGKKGRNVTEGGKSAKGRRGRRSRVWGKSKKKG